MMSHCPTCGSSSIETRFSNLSVSRCVRCRMMFRNPQPSDEDLNRFYDGAFQPENVLTHNTGMEGTTDALARQYISCLAARIGIKGKKVLEFGAGLGITCRALRAAGAKVTAIEPFAWRECSKSGVATYRSLDELPKGSKFDVILSLEVLEHLRSPLTTLRELQGRLRPGGWLYVATPNAASLRARLHGARWKELGKYGHMLFYTPATLELALKHAGFGRYARVRSHVRYVKNPGLTLAHYALQCAGLEGELRYLARSK
jgi:SAM-dependent methyltransferase